MDVTISTGAWSDLQAKVRDARALLSASDNAHKTAPPNRPEFSHDEYDIQQNTLHLICESEEQPMLTARILADGIVDQIMMSTNITEDVKTRFLSRTLREAITRTPDHDIIIRFHDDAIRAPALLESLQLPKENNEYRLSCDEALRLQLFDNSVLRLSSESEFMRHLYLMCRFGKRSLDILSIDLRASRFNRDIGNAVSKLARYHKNVRVRILVQNTQHLVGTTHPLASLAQKLSSSISIRKLNEEPDRAEQGYAIIDKKMLLYYNDEREATGFANYEAAAESEHFTEAFERLWQYCSEADPNLMQLHL